MSNTIPHQVVTKTRMAKALLRLLKSPKKNLRWVIKETILKETGKVPKVELLELLSDTPKIQLQDFVSRDGNLTPAELLAIAAIVADRRPMNLVEIGTFDGNTTLQLALNAPEGAIVHTIDLPSGETLTKEPVLSGDLKYILDEKKEQRKFEGKEAAVKIQQHFGDSTAYDFSRFEEVDFAFVDGGHTYECVKSDTENLLSILSKGAAILWHDYTPFFPGVFRYLNELSKTLPLRHIAGTNLCICLIQ
ncbi:MAG: hypothetical protein K940chlam2_01149 [Chlamydiae bacterium]|nr:hypothetical protein [Chlamydiota bacterium]